MGQAQPEGQLLRQDDGHMLAHYFIYFAMSESLHNTKLVKKQNKTKTLPKLRGEYQTGIITGLISPVSGTWITAFTPFPLG